MPIRYTSKGVYLFGVIVYSKIFVDRFHACMKIWLHEHTYRTCHRQLLSDAMQRRERLVMSKNELRSSGKHQRCGFANGAREL